MNIITDFVSLVTIYLAAFFVMLGFFLLSLQIFVALIAFKLGSLAAFIALPWGVFNGTAWVAERPLGWVAGCAMRLFVLALVVYGVLIGSWGVLSTPLAIIVTRLVTGLLFGALSSARVVIIARLLPAELQATGQTMAQAASSGLGSGLGAVVGGAVYGLFGPTVFFGLAGGMAIGGGVGAWFVLHGPLGARTPSIPPEMVEPGANAPGPIGR